MPFHPSYLSLLEPKPVQQAEYDLVRSVNLTQFGEAFSVLSEQHVLACAGCMKIWEGRATVWAFFSRHATLRDMVWIRKGTREFLDRQSYRRLETTVLAEFDDGITWAEKCGFSCEGMLRAYDPSGRDYLLFSRVHSWAT